MRTWRAVRNFASQKFRLTPAPQACLQYLYMRKQIQIRRNPNENNDRLPSAFSTKYVTVSVDAAGQHIYKM